jgi:hypothetical protein
MYRFFKCNRLGGFRLTDLGRKIQTDECFYFDKYTCDASRGIQGALKAKWMLEITEDEASQYILIPKANVIKEHEEKITEKKILTKTTVNAKELNKSLESRQAGRNFKPKAPMQKQKEEDKPIIPDFNAAERRMRERQADVTTKGPDQLLQSPVKVAEKKEVVIEPERKDVVANLAKEIGADNTHVSTPNFDEKVTAAKEEISKEIQKRVRRRRKSETINQEA